MIDEKLIHKKFLLMKPALNERSRRMWAATEAKTLGRGGTSAVSRATGISRLTILNGINELRNAPVVEPSRVRKAGGGRKKITKNDKTLEKDLERLVESTTRGNPELPMCYTIKSTRALMRELRQRGHKVSYPTIATLLHEKHYSLQANKKTVEGKYHPDRNAQFEFINNDIKQQIAKREPVVSVDTKKKELVDKNQGWVNVGIDSDTAEFAAESIRRWWKKIGKRKYPHAKNLTITADSGGSNSSRSRLWKWKLQQFSNKTRLSIRVRHFPPGTSKWNKIEHRLFSFISMNWRGKPLLTHAVIINLIAATTTTTGLKADCMLDKNKYPTGIKISNDDYDKIQITPENFHGEWNYTINPNNTAF